MGRKENWPQSSYSLNTTIKTFSIFQFCLIGIHWVSEKTRSIFPAGFAGQGVLNKDHTVWLDGARPNPKSTSKTFKLNNNLSKAMF